MSNMMFAWIWCAAQVTLISVFALFAMRIVLGRRPEIAARIGAWALGVSLLLAVLVPVQLPNSLFALTWDMSAHSSIVSTEAVISPVNLGEIPAPAGSSPQHGIRFKLGLLFRKSVELTKSSVPWGASLELYVPLFLGIGILGGFVRYILGLCLLNSLLRRAEMIRDTQLEAVANHMLQMLKPVRRIQVRRVGVQRIQFAQSAHIDCAAIVGFFRPVILLSKQWKSWSDSELQAVLAHELAHLCRRDSLTRHIATLCAAIHFYNPLIRSIFRRLALAQELSADQLAISITGESRIYLRSLAQLAIRQDDFETSRTRSLLVPFFSGHLIRRIEMLRAMDCEQAHVPRRWLASLVVVSIAMFGMTTTLMRCFAQSKAEEQSSADAAGAADTTLKTSVTQSSGPPSKQLLFLREKVPASHPALDKKGGLHLNMAALRQTPFGAVVDFELTSEFFDDAIAQNWDIKLVDSVTSDANISLLDGPKKPPENHQHSIAFGLDRLLLTTNRDIDWMSVIQSRFAKNIVSMSVESNQVDLSIPDLGPVPMRLHAVSPRQIGVAISFSGVPNDKLTAVDWSGKPEGRLKQEWSDEWDAVGGGLVSLVVALPEPPQIRITGEKFETQQFKRICEGADLFSIGVDYSAKSKLAEARIRVRCKESADSAHVLEAVDGLLQYCETEVTKKTGDSMADRVASDVLRSRKTRMITGSRNIIECQLHYALSPEVLAVLNMVPSPSTRASKSTPVGARPEATRVR